MKLKIKIKTPKGNATGTVSSKMWFLVKGFIKMNKYKGDVRTNKKHGDDTIIWTVDVTVSEMMKITKRVIMFDTIVSGIFESKKLKKAMKRMKWSKEKLKEVEWMIKDMTKIQIMKRSDEEEEGMV